MCNPFEAFRVFDLCDACALMGEGLIVEEVEEVEVRALEALEEVTE